MASNWRMNVFDLGLWGDVFDLVARYHTNPQVGIGASYRRNGKRWIGLVIARPDGLWEHYGTPVESETTMGFPFGNPVDPD